MHSPYHYLVLLFTLVLGVASGNLLSNYITAQYAAYELKQVQARLNEDRIEANRAATMVRQKRQAELERSRRESQKGKKLRRSCEDWKSAHNQLNNEISKQEMLKACDAYVLYVTKG